MAFALAGCLSLRKWARRTEDARIAGGRDPSSIWTDYLRASVICPKW
jgi:hypothetical protein